MLFSPMAGLRRSVVWDQRATDSAPATLPPSPHQFGGAPARYAAGVASTSPCGMFPSAHGSPSAMTRTKLFAQAGYREAPPVPKLYGSLEATLIE